MDFGLYVGGCERELFAVPVDCFWVECELVCDVACEWPDAVFEVCKDEVFNA